MVSFKAIVAVAVLAATTFLQLAFAIPTGNPSMTTDNSATITGHLTLFHGIHRGPGSSTCNRDISGTEYSLRINASGSVKVDALHILFECLKDNSDWTHNDL
jgi:hypothetical protein